MAKVKFEKNSFWWKLFLDFWKLCQEYWEPEDTDQWWQEVKEGVDRFAARYGNEIFPRRLGLALMDYLEDKNRRRKQDAGKKAEKADLH